MRHHRTRVAAVVLAGILALGSAARAQGQGDPKATEVWTPVPAVVTPGIGSAPPSDAIVLFDGKDLSQWERAQDGTAARWTIDHGVVTGGGGAGDIRTKRGFGDCQLHIEWRTPAKVEGEGQGRGNSGVYLMGRYEVQVLDSYNNPTYSNGQAASIYKQGIPLVNASRPPGEWQSYDIFFRAPHFNADGSVKVPAFVTVVHNGVLVQDHFEIRGGTVYIGQPKYEKHGDREPLQLQDHGNPVAYRNIWIREL
ncbi:MAG: 3-keto-disaccharide hydrolase [Gemmatimonadaceae bacterium]